MTSKPPKKNMPKTRQKNEKGMKIELHVVSPIPNGKGWQNIHLLQKVLPVMEQYADLLDDDSTNPKTNYGEWLDTVLEFIEDIAPWFYVVTADGEPKGAVWATNWQSYGRDFHAVEVGGVALRKINPIISREAMRNLVDRVFNETGVAIIRAEYDQRNRAVSWILNELGFNTPEPRRCYRIRNGEAITGTIKSITRTEWESLPNEQKKE